MKANPKKISKKTVLSKTLGATRYIMVFAIIAIFLGSTLLLIIASINMLQGIWHEIVGASVESQHEIKIILIESIDSILISTVLYVIAAGLYQLFINESLSIPEWMQTKDVDELERRLSGMIATILGVVFLTKAISINDTQELLWLALSISSMIVAISIFLYQDKKLKA